MTLMNKFYIKNDDGHYLCSDKHFEYPKDRYFVFWSKTSYSIKDRFKFNYVAAKIKQFIIYLMSGIKTKLEKVE